MRLLRLAPWRPAAALTIRSMGRGILPPATARSQAQLPSLPVPPLDKTAARLVESLRPLLSEKALTAAQQRISTFCAPGGPGPVIQEQLERRALAERNWLASWWEETAYRAYRSSVVVNSNPGVAFGPFTPRVTGAEPREDHAAQIIAGVLQWKLQWDRGGFPVEKFRNRPMCMMQSAKLLSSCRIPREGVDGFEAYTSDESKHFVVVHGGQFFAVDALDSDTDEPLSMSQIAHQLQHIVAAVSTMDHTARAPPVGILTSEHRDSLAFATGILEANPISKASLDKIRSSMFVVCLDEYEPESPSDLLALVLHGKGAEVASHNRWYDKLQLIFSSTGEGGINVEHSPFELVAAANLVDLAAGEFVPKLSDNAGGRHWSRCKAPPPRFLSSTLTRYSCCFCCCIESNNVPECARASPIRSTRRHSRAFGASGACRQRYRALGPHARVSIRRLRQEFLQAPWPEPRCVLSGRAAACVPQDARHSMRDLRNRPDTHLLGRAHRDDPIMHDRLGRILRCYR
eukprot:m.42344 g.42344  ORF g.42344 m.42344 type:complete len:516 (-) comp6090_c0_seq1:3561-5108(-)